MLMPRLDITRLRKNRSIFLKVGFILSLAFVTYAFNLEVHPGESKFLLVEDGEEPYDYQIPNTIQKKKLILPPPPKEQIIEPEPIEETPEFVEELIPDDIPVDAVQYPEPVDLRNILPPAQKFDLPESDKEDVPDIKITKKIWDYVEQMPRFPGCEELEGSLLEKKTCAEKKMMEFIYGQVKYPTVAREIGEEGTVVISFVINKNGKPTDFEIVREPGNLLGREAIRVVKQMPNWTPGKQRGRNVAVRYKMPLRFHLE